MDDFASEVLRSVTRVKHYAKVFSPDVDAIWAMDLAEMGAWAASNDGYRYILCAVDVFSRYAWCRPIKTRNLKASDVWQAFTDIMKQGVKPGKIWVDQGSEFYNALWTRELGKLKIGRYSTYGEHKASVVERFNRTLKHAIWFEFLKLQTRSWADKLQTIVDNYNTTLHHGIGMTPTLARTADGRSRVFEQTTNSLGTQGFAKYAVGTWVRISRKKGTFEKGYDQNWTSEIYKIVNTKLTDPVLYYLQDYYGDKIHGAFYENELHWQPVKDPEFFPTEKVMERKTIKGVPMAYVKLVGYLSPALPPPFTFRYSFISIC